jgi:hypothetical protein
MKSEILIAATRLASAVAAASMAGGPVVQETSGQPDAAELRPMVARFAQQ